MTPRASRLLVLLAILAGVLTSVPVALADPPVNRLPAVGDTVVPTSSDFAGSALAPTSDPNVSEVVNTRCVFPEGSRDGRTDISGQELTSGQTDKLGNIVKDALAAYKNEDDEAQRGAKMKDKLGDLLDDNPEYRKLVPITDQPAAVVSQLNGCTFNLETSGFPSLKELVGDTSGFFVDTTLWLPTKLAGAGYNAVAPAAFRYTFFTPHTERGDTLLDIVDCDARHDTTCAQTQKTGFRADRITNKSKQNGSDVIAMAIMLRFLVTLIVPLLFVLAALLFMIQGNKARLLRLGDFSYHLVIAFILIWTLPTMVGWGVSLSNAFTRDLFERGRCDGSSVLACNTLSNVNRTLTNMTLVDKDAWHSDIAGRLVQLVAVCGACFFMATFAVLSILRQVVFAGAIVLLPVAVFAVTFERGRNFFWLWSRVVIACLLTPLLMALALMLGTALNPLARTGAVTDPLKVLVGMLLLFVPLWVASKVFRFMIAWARGGMTQPMAQRMAARVGGMLSAVPNPYAQAGGAALGGYASSSGMVHERMAAFVPNRAGGVGVPVKQGGTRFGGLGRGRPGPSGETIPGPDGGQFGRALEAGKPADVTAFGAGGTAGAASGPLGLSAPAGLPTAGARSGASGQPGSSVDAYGLDANTEPWLTDASGGSVADLINGERGRWVAAGNAPEHFWAETQMVDGSWQMRVRPGAEVPDTFAEMIARHSTVVAQPVTGAAAGASGTTNGGAGGSNAGNGNGSGAGSGAGSAGSPVSGATPVPAAAAASSARRRPAPTDDPDSAIDPRRARIQTVAASRIPGAAGAAATAASTGAAAADARTLGGTAAPTPPAQRPAGRSLNTPPKLPPNRPATPTETDKSMGGRTATPPSRGGARRPNSPPPKK